MDQLPFSQAAQNNQAPILVQLRRLLANSRRVVELGAGTGQHAVAFASALAPLRWQPSEHPEALPILMLRCANAGLKNLDVPIALDMSQRPWPVQWPDALYTANTLHIVAESLVEALFCACAEQASPGSLLLVYGPFNYAGEFTSESNAHFDLWLKDRDARSGIRDFEWVNELAERAGFALDEDIAMPANNRLVCWHKC
ncbi:MAG: DUF938 domain-containing protein [Congregibacter sp.]